MKRKKRILLFVLMIVFGSVLAACGSSPSTETPSMADKTEAVPEAQLTEETGNSESTEFTEEQARRLSPSVPVPAMTLATASIFSANSVRTRR